MTKPDRWIEETFHPHWRVALKASKVLHEVKTEHQHLIIFDNETGLPACVGRTSIVTDSGAEPLSRADLALTVK